MLEAYPLSALTGFTPYIQSRYEKNKDLLLLSDY